MGRCIKIFGSANFNGYLMVQKDHIQIHFFEYEELDLNNNYGQVYIRTDDIDTLHQSMLDNNVPIHPARGLQIKPWEQKEFSMFDTDNQIIMY